MWRQQKLNKRMQHTQWAVSLSTNATHSCLSSMATNIILQTESKSSSPITLDRLLPTMTELAIFGTSTSSVRALLICINQTVYLWLCNALAVLNLSGKEFEAHAPADNLFPLQGVNPLLVPWFPCCTLHSEINYARIYNAAYPFAHATALSAQEAGDSNIAIL